MPKSALSFSSTVLSSTMFMNWSKPRSTPVTCRLAFSLTAAVDVDKKGGTYSSKAANTNYAAEADSVGKSGGTTSHR